MPDAQHLRLRRWLETAHRSPTHRLRASPLVQWRSLRMLLARRAPARLRRQPATVNPALPPALPTFLVVLGTASTSPKHPRLKPLQARLTSIGRLLKPMATEAHQAITWPPDEPVLDKQVCQVTPCPVPGPTRARTRLSRRSPLDISSVRKQHHLRPAATRARPTRCPPALRPLVKPTATRTPYRQTCRCHRARHSQRHRRSADSPSQRRWICPALGT